MGAFPKIFALIIALFCLFIGLRSGYEGVRAEQLAAATQSWKTAEARVIESHGPPEEKGSGGSHHYYARSTRGAAGALVAPLFAGWLRSMVAELPEDSIVTRCRYRVGDDIFDSSRYSPEVYLANQLEREKFADAHPQGTKLIVYYNPLNPSEAVIHREIGIEGRLLTFGSALVFLVLGSVIGAACLLLKEGTLPTVRVFDVAVATLQLGIAGAMVFFGGAMIEDAVNKHHLAAQSARWPTANGVVTTAHLTKLFTAEEGSGVDLRVKVINAYAYRYTVDDQPYEGKTISFEGGPDDGVFAGQHTQGTEVVVYYNPENPQVSTLIAGTQKTADKTSNHIGTALLLGGTVLIIVFLGRTIMIFSRAAGTDKPKGKRQKR